MADLWSPKQVAKAIGVSESSLKRWCDQGLIDTVRTAGGHRRLTLGAVVKFTREHDYNVIVPESLGLPASGERVEQGLTQVRERLTTALLAGDELVCHRLISDLVLAKHTISLICDQVIASAFITIGDKWSRAEADVYQERQACEISIRILHELLQAVPTVASGPRALGGTVAGDQYALPTAMVEVVLRDAGWKARSLGTSLPWSALQKAVVEQRPRLFWLSISHIENPACFVDDFARFFDTVTASGTALAVGGRALTEAIRRQLRYAAFCDTLQQLEAFGRTLNCATRGE